MTDHSHIAQNEAERRRLQALVARLTDQDLARPLAGGWTIASVLGHAAFWDQRILALLHTWKTAGIASPPPGLDDLDEGHVDWINDSVKPFLLALPPRKCAELAVAIAEEVDREVAALSEELQAANAKIGSPLNLQRAEHRREHLEEIDAALRAG
jgi:hypothetical protein